MVDSDGEVIVSTYDWVSFFARALFKKLSEIKVTHYFHMTSTKPGVVVAKQQSDSAGKEHNILKDGAVVELDGMPPVIEPKGLSSQRYSGTCSTRSGSSALLLTRYHLS